jgi:glycosyltransferase involved in cell wall biosynthesis
VKQALAEISKKHDGLIICIMDSLRTKHAVWKFVNELGIQEKTKIVYYQCGFSTYLPSDKYNMFSEGINDIIYLTRSAYEYELVHNPALPFTAHVLHNPIDHKKFCVPSEEEKKNYKIELGMQNGVQFIWASQDRPKKGLEVVLQAWQKYYKSEMDVTLNIVGVHRQVDLPGVRFHGKKPNHDMYKYFKAADIGIFSSLWSEGFSLSLSEQISCGLLCIASTAGCVNEFFKEKDHGIAISHPNFVNDWVIAFENGIEQLPAFKQQVSYRQAPVFLTYDQWCEKFCSIFSGVEAYYFKN